MGEGCRASEAGLSVRHYLITGIDKSRETAGDAFFTRLKLSWEATKPQVQQLYFSNSYLGGDPSCSSPLDEHTLLKIRNITHKSLGALGACLPFSFTPFERSGREREEKKLLANPKKRLRNAKNVVK